jgi:hypothetical protein
LSGLEFKIIKGNTLAYCGVIVNSYDRKKIIDRSSGSKMPSPVCAATWCQGQKKLFIRQ